MNVFNARIITAILIVLALTIIPLPEWASAFRPPWVLLLVLYIQFFLPSYFHVPMIFVIGLLLDALLATIIGVHVFALILTTWIASGRARRFNFFPIGQQMILVLLFSAIYQTSIMIIDAFLGYNFQIWMPAFSAFMAMLFWPWIRLVGDNAIWMKVPSH